jgi:hypothetical protein
MIAYITEIRASDENMAHIREPSKKVDVLFIEAYILTRGGGRHLKKGTYGHPGRDDRKDADA